VAGGMLTMASVMTCPHGGTIKATTSNTQVSIAGVRVLRSSDRFVVANCPFFIGTKPSPCLTVKWIVADLRSDAARGATLSQSSIGLCLNEFRAPQGIAVVRQTQTAVSSM
jgi:hypothetical protein